MIVLKCGCCGFEQEYANSSNAYLDGWDEPDHLPSWPISCPLCPGVGALGVIDHSAAHRRWEKEGRPKQFEMLEGDDVETGLTLEEAINRRAQKIHEDS